MTVDAYPLAWPAGWPRTPQRRRRYASFRTPLDAARHGLHDELRLLGATDVVVSTNAPLRKDGHFYATFSGKLEDPGVAVYFRLNGEERVIPCDRWATLAANVQAIRKTVEALRGITRWGASEMMHAAFAGFAALPAGGEGSGVAWWEVLGVPRTITQNQLFATWRAILLKHHPDAGGDPEQFLRLKDAYEQGKAEIS